MNDDPRLKEIRRIASSHGWVEICHQQNICMVSFSNAGVRMNVYYTRMTVATCMRHPKKGHTQLFRKNVDFRLLEKLFKNPRTHTDLGYYTCD